MKYGVFVAFNAPISTPDVIANIGKKVEQAGFESIWMGEHVVLFDEMEFPYPGSKDGKIPMPEGGGMLDTVALIGYMAANTEKLRFGTGITLVPQRNPVYTAKEFATLDWLSQGRIDFGVGVGWCKEEVLNCGYTWQDRGKRCDEYLQVIEALWTQDVASFSGEHYSLTDCRMGPKPIQQPHIPMIIGGHSKAGLRRAARFGAGWYGFSLSPKMTRGLLANLDQELEKQGRSRADFEIVVTPPYVINKDMLHEFEEMGVDRLIIQLGSPRLERMESRLEEIGQLIAA